MIDLHSVKKNKINLTDYDHQLDITSRSIFSGITRQEIEVLEEILCSSLKFPMSEIARNLEIRLDELKIILRKIEDLSLIRVENDQIIVNKELRKYFDGEILKFDERFIPGMEYIQTLLKKVPIHVLPTWYLIPRTSDNIFDSLVEKIFSTPQIYQRHLHEVKPVDGLSAKIYELLFNSPQLKLYLSDLISELSISKQELHEIILDLEFNFIACLSYEAQDDVFVEVLTPFHEWREFLIFSKNHHPQSISTPKKIEHFRESEYAFVEDIETLLAFCELSDIAFDKPSSKKSLDTKNLNLIREALKNFDTHSIEEVKLYVLQLIEKSMLVGLSEITQGLLKPTKFFRDWIKQDIERKSHYIYKHSNNHFLNPNCPKELVQEKNIREIEKSLSKLCKCEWVYFDDFLKGCIAAIGDNGKVELKKTGKLWRYHLPDYSDKEKLFIQIALLEWLFESGIVQTGVHQFRPCFKLTGLGKKMFI